MRIRQTRTKKNRRKKPKNDFIRCDLFHVVDERDRQNLADFDSFVRFLLVHFCTLENDEENDESQLD